MILTAILCSDFAQAQAPSLLPAPEKPDVVLTGTEAMTNLAHPPAWGTNGTTMMQVTSHDFRPGSSTTTFATYWNTGYMYKVAGTSFFYASLNLPNGAQITGYGIDGYDTSAADDITFGMLKMTPDHGGDQDLGWYFHGTAAGYYSATATLASPHTVDHNNYYCLMVNLSVTGQTMAFRGMRVYYKLQVSPAPAVASFTDVPTSYWAFQYIEALKASGITQGVTPTTYEPESNVTRAQMAVFLAKALGLHWPN
jgi:hypothetical protein